MTLFEEWWATYKNSGRKRQLSVDDLSLDAFRAGMLAAADIAQNLEYATFAHRDTQTAIAIGIRKRANDI